MTPDQIRKMASFCDGRTITVDAKTGELLRALTDVFDEARHFRHNLNAHNEADNGPLFSALARLEALKA